jgi:NADH-quinone oxidoreductase subunit A
MWLDPDAWEYLPILILMTIAAVIGIVMVGGNIIVPKLMGEKPRVNGPEKSSVYECGVTAVGTARQQFSVRYYVVGIVFLLFDVEVMFMYPWAVIFKKYIGAGIFILIEMAIFMALLVVGYVYLLGRKGLDWD